MNDWMVSQADLPALEEPTSRHGTDRETESARFSILVSITSEVELKISEVWVSEAIAESASEEGTPPRRIIRSEASLVLEGNQIFDQDVPSQFQLRIYMVDLESNKSQLIAVETGELSPADNTKTIEKDFDIPPTGHYQLYSIAKLLPPNTSASYLQGPIIKAEPY